MSLSAIQDNLIKTNLVQQTQTKGDDVARGHENAAAATQKEEARRQDEVVLSTHETEGQTVRPDEEKEQGRNKDEDEEEREEKEEGAEEDTGPRAKMRTINVVI